MAEFRPHDAEYESRVRASFAKQFIMETLGATMTRVEPGVVEIDLPFRAGLTQQSGFLHAGAVTTILDSACGYAAYSLMPADAGVLTVEFKVNLLAPAKGDLFRARGVVKRAGRTLTVCTADAWAVSGGTSEVVATMVNTVMCLAGRRELAG